MFQQSGKNDGSFEAFGEMAASAQKAMFQFRLSIFLRMGKANEDADEYHRDLQDAYLKRLMAGIDPKESFMEARTEIFPDHPFINGVDYGKDYASVSLRWRVMNLISGQSNDFRLTIAVLTLVWATCAVLIHIAPTEFRHQSFWQTWAAFLASCAALSFPAFLPIFIIQEAKNENFLKALVNPFFLLTVFAGIFIADATFTANHFYFDEYTNSNAANDVIDYFGFLCMPFALCITMATIAALEKRWTMRSKQRLQQEVAARD